MSTPKPKRRWYHLTPDQFVVGLLAVEVLLLVSERGRWLPKGWAVLTEVAALGLGIVVLVAWFGVGLLLRRGFRFGLRTLLSFVVISAIVCSWCSVTVRRAGRQREAVEVIDEAGGWVNYDDVAPTGPTKPPAPAWLRKLLGDDFFSDVISGSVERNFGDAQSEHLEGLTKLKELQLNATRGTDAGLVHLAGLPDLEELILNQTEVIDAGLERLAGLANLRRLELRDTQVTSQGVEKLQRALPDCHITRKHVGSWDSMINDLSSTITGRSAFASGRRN